MYLANSPFWLQWLYPSFVWHKSRGEKFIYLTFDDGPIPVVTPFVLNTLKTFNAKATFFCIGDNIARHPEIYSQLLSEGHAVGNHTFNHLRGWDTSNRDYVDNFCQCDKMVDSLLFRPPYGRIKRSQVTQLRELKPELKIVMWDVLSGDFDNSIGPEKCLENVIKNARNGSIIVFHDSLKAYPRLQYALPATLEYLSSRGFKFLPL
ncbi:polysaccharide deacetylase family protein [Flavihumibacter sp. R14]|nr:polysaccharide deacetylase family protein [Flavihumibacter soli]